jgi:hypothetical protein
MSKYSMAQPESVLSHIFYMVFRQSALVFVNYLACAPFPASLLRRFKQSKPRCFFPRRIGQDTADVTIKRKCPLVPLEQTWPLEI